jgi:hypothetical protein
MGKKLLVSRIKTPDGTILHSKYRYDYVIHTDANGEEYMLDGGNDYQRVSVNIEPFKDISLYDDSPFEEIRKAYCRGGRGKNGDQPLKWVPLCEMSDEWLKNCIKYNDELGLSKSISTSLYYKELEYRQQMGITIEDYDTE